MKITIFGCGYVGLVTAACFSQVGNQVICVDNNEKKLKKLKQGVIDIFEPELENILKASIKKKNIEFTNDTAKAVTSSTIIFICVNTPPLENGDADLSKIISVAESIGANINGFKIISTKSTVPVGTSRKIKKTINSCLEAKIKFEVASNPEFLKEGSAVKDFMRPDRIVVGINSNQAKKIFQELYGPFNRNHDKLIFMDIESAELTKYAANTMLASRISLMNELANIAECVGADIEHVRKGIGSDPRIGYNFIYPGCGYGGSCLPKDVKALNMTAKKCGYDAKIIQAVNNVNENQKEVIFNKIMKRFGKIKNKKFAVWGLSFKPNTNDLREAPSKKIIELLKKNGAKVIVYDPISINEFKKEFKDIKSCDSMYEVLNDCDALIINTEWQEFKSPNFKKIKSKLKENLIFDGRNMYDPKIIKKYNIEYHCIGRK